MKREILFKGKLSYSKEWIEGNVIIARNGKPYIIPFDVLEPDGHHLRIDSDNPYWVDKETICQSTGLTDRNGVKIFEGDIVKGLGTFCGAITFKYGCFCWNEEPFTWETNDLEFCDTKLFYEIIGNIHDNPELLK